MKWWEVLWKQNPETDIDHSRGPDPDDLTVDNAVSYTHLTLPTILLV